MNEQKAKFLMNPSDLQLHRLATTQRQLTEYWYSRTLVQLQKILCIRDQYLIYNILFQQYLKYYLNNKKISPGQLFHVMYKEQILTYVYDAKIFRNPGYEKYYNDLISTFLVAYRQKEEVPQDDVFEFLDYGILEPQQWILKVKESAILRIFPFIIHRFLQKKQSCFDPSLRNPIGGYYLSSNPNLNREVVILDPKVYYYYMYSHMYTFISKFNPSIEMQVKELFQTVVDLMYNNLLISWYDSLSEEQKYERHFKRYFRLIQKPKNKQQFTSIDNKFTQIKWQSFKSFVFKLKYKIVQTQDHYQCYQIDLKSEEQLTQPYGELSADDQNILKAFQKKRISSPDYDNDYKPFAEEMLN